MINQLYTNIEDCYLKIGTSSYIKKWFDINFDNLKFDIDIFDWAAEECPREIWLSEPTLSLVHSQFPILRAGFLRIDPFKCYDWHTDTTRGLTINCIMTPEVNSLCVFGNSITSTLFDCVQLIYAPNSFYLFNTQISHMVLNLDSPRYMFGVEFEQDKTLLSYFQVKNWLTTKLK